jgi:hypothetical protein
VIPGDGCPGVSIRRRALMKVRAGNSEERCRASNGEVTDSMLPRKAQQ